MDTTNTRLPGGQSHSDDVLTMAPDERMKAETKIESTLRAPQWTITKSPSGIGAAKDQSRPAAADEISTRGAPSVQIAPVPSEKSFELMDQLEALARDFASSQHVSSDQPTDKTQGESDLSPKVEGEPTIHVPPRGDDFDVSQFRSEGPSTGRRIVSTAISLFVAAILGLGAAFAWQSYRFWTAVSPGGAEQTASVSADRTSPTQPAPIEPNALASSATAPAPTSPAEQPPAQSAAPAQAAAAPAAPMAPELQRQIEAMAQDLAVVRRGMEDVTAKQGQLASLQQQLDQLSTAQQQLTARQEQMAQTIAKLQAGESARRKVPPPQPRVSAATPQRATSGSASPSAAPSAAVSPPPAATQPQPAAQATAAPRASNQPVPPLPVPPDYRPAPR